MDIKYLSGTALAKELGMATRDFFSLLLEMGFIEKDGDNWKLTEIGKEKGGQTRNSQQYGTWIVWPEKIKDELLAAEKDVDTPISTTILSEKYNIPRNRINLILSELGFIAKDRKGWILTNLGKTIGGKQFEHPKTGIPYVRWVEGILNNKRLVETFKELSGKETEEPPKPVLQQQQQEEKQSEKVGFREKFEAKQRAADGHFVRSKSEMLIDNWLYMSELVHAYERKLPIEEDAYCDFYLPGGKVYIEYWGIEDNDKYLARKKIKQDIYQKYGFHLIELDEADIQNLDDVLPRKLLKFGIQTG